MSFAQRIGLDRFNPAQGGVRGMRVVAGGLLILMAALYLAARHWQPAYPALGYLRAFSEAAMVGGMADWFAVTALFRHPLGLPIPHTAIIPRNKDRIGDTLAAFLKDNFLTASVVARRMRRVDVAGAAGRFLAAPSALKGRIGDGGSRLLIGLFEALDHERLGGMVKAGAVARLRALDLGPLLGQALEAAIERDRHLPVIDTLIKWVSRTLAANEQIVREMVSKRAGSILRWTGLDARVADAVVGGLHKLIDEMAADPRHPLRGKAEEGLASLASDLQHDPEMRARVARWRDEIVANPAVAKWIDGLWEQARAALIRAARNPQAALGGKIGEAVRGLGATLQQDAGLKRSINQFARRATVGAVAAYGDAIVRLVSETIRGWDARTVTGRLESAVGRDLQYIRINGTLVGGLVGLAIHVLDVI